MAAALILACVSGPRVPPPSVASPPASTAPEPASRSAPQTPGLVLRTLPADAELLVDGRSFGKVSALPGGDFVPLPPGFHQLTLRREGYSTWRAEVAIRSGREFIDVTLVKQP